MVISEKNPMSMSAMKKKLRKMGHRDVLLGVELLEVQIGGLDAMSEKLSEGVNILQTAVDEAKKAVASAEEGT